MKDDPVMAYFLFSMMLNAVLMGVIGGMAFMRGGCRCTGACRALEAHAVDGVHGDMALLPDDWPGRRRGTVQPYRSPEGGVGWDKGSKPKPSSGIFA